MNSNVVKSFSMKEWSFFFLRTDKIMKKSPHVHSVSHKPLASALSEIFIKGR